MTYQHEAVCNCTRKSPWPEMQRLSVGGLNRYFLCTQCENVREEVCRPNGMIVKVRYHQIESEVLSKTVSSRFGHFQHGYEESMRETVVDNGGQVKQGAESSSARQTEDSSGEIVGG